MYGYIYKTTNLINGKFYIGKHRGEKFDGGYFGSGVLILEALKKYGKNNFKCEIIEWCETSELLNERERYWVEELNARDLSIAYNLCAGGMGGNRELNEESRKRIGDAHRGKSLSETTRNKIHESYMNMNPDSKKLRSQRLHDSHVGKTLSETQRKNIGKTLHEKYASGELVSACKGKPSSNKGRKMTADQVSKMRDRVLDRIWIKKEYESKMIWPEELEKYIEEGWTQGRIMKNMHS